MAASHQSQAAQAAAIEAEQRRQRQLQKESMGAVTDSTAATGRQGTDQSLGQAIAARTAQYQSPTPGAAATTAPLPGTGSAPSVIANEQGRATAGATASGAQQALQKAILDAWGDAGLSSKIRLNRNAGKIGMLGGFQAGSEGVLPLEIQSASQKGGGWAMAGDALNAMSQGVGLAKGAGASLDWSDLNPWARTSFPGVPSGARM